MSKYKRKKSLMGRILYIILLIFLLWMVYKLYDRYSLNNFNDFTRAEQKKNSAEFVRDNEVKYSDKKSYKISLKQDNDAMFYKTVKVKPNTPYKVSCMVKTQDVKTKKEVSEGGAHICIADTVEKSKSITGTNDWQKLEFIFNSKNRTSVDIGFRVGGNEDDCTGTAWFSDFKIELGSRKQ